MPCSVQCDLPEGGKEVWLELQELSVSTKNGGKEVWLESDPYWVGAELLMVGP